ncbi:hypothetical protein MTO96_047680 [Rhipicephalus appendiculatus]
MERIEMSRNTSAFCDVPPNPNAASTSCQRKRDSMRCTANCMTGFQFPDGRRHMTLNCDLSRHASGRRFSGSRTAKESVSLSVSMGVVATVTTAASAPISTGETIASTPSPCAKVTCWARADRRGTATTRTSRPSARCRVPQDSNSRHPGAAPVYRCSLQGVWDPPVVPPCVPDYTSSSHTNVTGHGDFHQGQQTVTEGSEHGGQQPLDLGGLVTEVTTKKNLTSDSLTDKGSDLPPEEIPGENELPPRSTGVCSTWGRFQFKSFDGTLFRFAGACSYVLLKDCAQPDPSAKFSVELQHSAGCPDAANCTRTLHLVGSGAGERVSITLGQTPPEDAQPLVDAIPGLSAQHAGKYLVLQSPQGIHRMD